MKTYFYYRFVLFYKNLNHSILSISIKFYTLLLYLDIHHTTVSDDEQLSTDINKEGKNI